MLIWRSIAVCGQVTYRISVNKVVRFVYRARRGALVTFFGLDNLIYAVSWPYWVKSVAIVLCSASLKLCLPDLSG